MKKNIAILIYSLAGGGAERVVSILLNELCHKYNLHLFLMRDKIEYDIPKNIKIHYLEKHDGSENKYLKILKLPLLAYKYKRICKKLDITTSLSFLYRLNFINVLAHRIFKNKNIKVLISERSNITMQPSIYKLLVKKLYPLADIIIPNSNGSANVLVSNFNIPSNKIQVIHNPNSETTKNSKLIKNNNAFTFITVGRLNKLKNHQSILHALSMIDKKYKLILLGDGEERKELEKLSIELNISNKVEFAGFKNNVSDYLLRADAFVFTSKHEGFPNVLLEALKAQLPIISTDCSFGPREILAPNTPINKKIEKGIEIAKYGILIPVNKVNELKDAMVLLLNDKKIIDNYKTLSLERASDFDIKNIIPQFIKALKN